MTENKINAMSEGLELHELSSEELDAVSGGDAKDQARENALEAARQQHENNAQVTAMRIFRQLLREF